MNRCKISYNVLSSVAIVLVAAGFFFPRVIEAQEVVGIPIYDVTAKVDAVGRNFVKARKKAVTAAMQVAVKTILKDMLGNEVYQTSLQLLEETISKPQRYVRGYRFLQTDDNVDEMVAEVRLEVTLFTEALRKKMKMLGILAGSGAEGTVVILIKGQSLSSPEETGFWDYTPFPETTLAQSFAAAGFLVVERNTLRSLVSEKMVLNATRGDIKTAASIGWKVGADTVIIGNAVSKQVRGQTAMDMATIRANISLKAVSSLNSVIIAARSDFATADGEDVPDGEREAFNKVSSKLSGFLIDSIRKFRTKKIEAPATSQPESSKPPALPITDL